MQKYACQPDPDLKTQLSRCLSLQLAPAPWAAARSKRPIGRRKNQYHKNPGLLCNRGDENSKPRVGQLSKLRQFSRSFLLCWLVHAYIVIPADINR